MDRLVHVVKRSRIATYVVALLLALPCALAAQQGEVRIDLPPQDPFPAAPEITVRALNFPAATAPRSIRLRLALDAGFGLIVFDSTLAGDQARFTLTRLLPENRDIYLQVTVFGAQQTTLTTVSQVAGRTGARLQLLSPNQPKGNNIDSRTPRFSWRSAIVTSPPGPWVYDIYFKNNPTLEVTAYKGITDTNFTVPAALEANAPYSWRVVAHLVNGSPLDSVSVSSKATFTITPGDAPLATLLYQNFPNPFPAASSQTTCIWFDLKLSARVSLTVLDLRGSLVKTLVPSASYGTILPGGRYGRLREADGGGCDPRLTWDGTAENGRTVPAGIYLLRFKTDNAAESVKKIVFLGH